MQACVAKPLDMSTTVLSVQATGSQSEMTNGTVMMDCERVAIRNDPVVTILTALLSQRSGRAEQASSVNTQLNNSCGESRNAPWRVRVNELTSTDSLLEVSRAISNQSACSH